MILWRISEYDDLSGAGGVAAAGRWNSGKTAVVYAAESSALAMLEILVGYDVDFAPPTFQLLRIDVGEGLPSTDFSGPVPSDLEASRAWGENWLALGEVALARVPSAIAPESWNWLINPAHPDTAHIKIVAKTRWPWDTRLFAT